MAKVIFTDEQKAQAYTDKIQSYLTQHRPGYNATKWSDPIKSSDNLLKYIQEPPEEITQLWEVPINTLAEKVNTIITIQLPAIGQPCAKDVYYSYGGDILKCRQTHNRTIYEPKDTPALFSFYRDNSDGLQWLVGEQVQVGWMRIYNGVKYEVTQAHQTQIDWMPNVATTLWKIYIDPLSISAWAYPVSYIVNQQVTYNGKTYKCIQAHTSNIAWTPTAANTLWQLTI